MATHQDLEKQFEGLSEEDKTYLGLVGLARVINEETDKSQEQEEPSTYNMMGDYMNDNFDEYQSILIDDDSLETLVMMMKHETFKVRLMNALADIVEPLTMKLDQIEEQRLVGEDKRHGEDMLYQQALIEAVHGIGADMDGSIIRSIMMGTRMFARHPIWSTMKLLGNSIGVITDTVKVSLFGFRKQKTDTDRIVESVNKLREFMMTGQVDERRGALERFLRTGLIESMRDRVLNFAGINEELAQQAEDKRSRGETITTSERIALETFTDIVRRGRQGYGFIPDGRTVKPKDEEDSKEENAIFELRSDLVMYIDTEIKPLLYSIDQSLMNILSGDANEFSDMLSESMMKRAEKHSIVATGRVELAVNNLKDIVDGHYTEYEDNFREEIQLKKEDSQALLNLINLNEDILEVSEDNERFNKKQYREQKRLRTQMLLTSIISGIGTVMTSLGSLAGSIGGAITSALGGLGLGAAGGAMASKASALLMNPWVAAAAAVVTTGAVGYKWFEEAQARAATSGKSTMQEFFDPDQSIVFSKAKELYNMMEGAFTDGVDVVTEKTNQMKEVFTSFINDIKEWVTQAVESAKTALTNAWTTTKETVSSAAEKAYETVIVAPSTAFREFAVETKDDIKQTYNDVVDGIIKFITPDKQTVSESMFNTKTITAPVNNVTNQVQDSMNYLSNAVRDGGGEVMNRYYGDIRNASDSELTVVADKLADEVSKMQDAVVGMSAEELALFGQMRDLLKQLVVKTDQSTKQTNQQIQPVLNSGIDDGLIGAIGY